MNESMQPASSLPRVAAGEDRFNEFRGLGVSSIAFKVSMQESSGLFILENTFREKGGPARHMHYHQDEWFYAVEGDFLFEVGSERFALKPGDSLLAPRKVHIADMAAPPEVVDEEKRYARAADEPDGPPEQQLRQRRLQQQHDQCDGYRSHNEGAAEG